MDRTGALDIVWPWACTHWCDVNNICATPVLDWKTPILVCHGHTPDMSAFLQHQFWERICFEVDESSPSTKELPGYWLGVSKTVGDAMTFDIHSPTSDKVLQRSAICPATEANGGFPNKRLSFPDDDEDANPEGTMGVEAPERPRQSP